MLLSSECAGALRRRALCCRKKTALSAVRVGAGQWSIAKRTISYRMVHTRGYIPYAVGTCDATDEAVHKLCRLRSHVLQERIVMGSRSCHTSECSVQPRAQFKVIQECERHAALTRLRLSSARRVVCCIQNVHASVGKYTEGSERAARLGCWEMPRRPCACASSAKRSFLRLRDRQLSRESNCRALIEPQWSRGGVREGGPVDERRSRWNARSKTAGQTSARPPPEASVSFWVRPWR